MVWHSGDRITDCNEGEGIRKKTKRKRFKKLRLSGGKSPIAKPVVDPSANTGSAMGGGRGHGAAQFQKQAGVRSGEKGSEDLRKEKRKTPCRRRKLRAPEQYLRHTHCRVTPPWCLYSAKGGACRP